MSRDRALVRSRVLLVLHYSLRLLIVLTPVLLVWNHFGMNRVFELSTANGHEFTVKDDRPLAGGSIATLTRSDKSTVMDCHIEKKYEWPFCDLTIQVAAVPNGVDFTQYDS